jgi:hypothetical protein
VAERGYWHEHGITIGLSAPTAQQSMLEGWLTSAGYDPPCIVEAAESTESVRARSVRTLISYYPSAHQTAAAVTPSVLHGLNAGATWIQLGPMPVDIVGPLTAQAHIASVHLLHAPYVSAPTSRGELPLLVAYCDDDHPSADILRALAAHIHWTGPAPRRTGEAAQ